MPPSRVPFDDFEVADSDEERPWLASSPVVASVEPLRSVLNLPKTPVNKLSHSKNYTPSTISQFTATVVQTLETPFIPSSISEFPPSKQPTQLNKNVSQTEIIDLSDSDEVFPPPKLKKKKAKPLTRVESSEVMEIVTIDKKKKSKKKINPDSVTEVNASLHNQTFGDDQDAFEPSDHFDKPDTVVTKPKKPKPRKKRTIESPEPVIPSPPPVVSRKRKNRDDDESGKVKKRKRGEPEPGDISDKEKVEASDDELLLGSVIADEDVETEPRKSSEKPVAKPATPIIPKTATAAPQEEPKEEPKPVLASSLMPPKAPSLNTMQMPREGVAHSIPKGGSISSLLRKTGLHAPLMSSRLTRLSGSRIAPLHLERKTPPPPLPLIPKPKKRQADDNEEDEEDYTGLTEKQIAKLKEEKMKRAWYSP